VRNGARRHGAFTMAALRLCVTALTLTRRKTAWENAPQSLANAWQALQHHAGSKGVGVTNLRSTEAIKVASSGLYVNGGSYAIYPGSFCEHFRRGPTLQRMR